jgi:hypothetical protein
VGRFLKTEFLLKKNGNGKYSVLCEKKQKPVKKFVEATIGFSKGWQRT